MNTIILYGFPGSTYLRTVEMACLIKDVPYQQKGLEFRKASHKALHPFLKMPIMRHGDLVLFESLAICCYLEDLYPKTKLIPEDPILKAKTMQWVSAFIDYLAPTFIHGKPEDETQKWPEKTADLLAVLDQTLANQAFLASDQPGLADLYLSPAIEYALGGSGFDQLLAQCPNLLSWWKKASACPIFEKTQSAA